MSNTVSDILETIIDGGKTVTFKPCEDDWLEIQIGDRFVYSDTLYVDKVSMHDRLATILARAAFLYRESGSE